MQKKWANIDFNICQPAECAKADGPCSAAAECPHNLLEQEEATEPPMLLSAEMCVGCGDCVKVCPMKAIVIVRG